MDYQPPPPSDPPPPPYNPNARRAKNKDYYAMYQPEGSVNNNRVGYG